MIERLAIGDWVSGQRVRIVCALLLTATLIGYGALLFTAHGTLDAMGRPLGTDFSDVYAAGWMADHGRAAQAWVWPLHYAVQQTIHHSAAVPFYGWHYPPLFLLLASVLARLPYLPALALWQAATIATALLVIRRIVPGRDTLLVALAAPATFVCIGHGQNAFLTASLLGGGMLLLDRRPWVAGSLLGCLVYKPQFAVLLPVALVAATNPRAFAGAATSSLALVGLTLAVWGWPVWEAFLHSLPITRHIVIEQGETGWEKIVTPFAAMRAWGASVAVAYAVQALSTASAVIATGAAARWGTPRIRGAMPCCAALLSTPYALDYDLVILGPAIAFLVADAHGRGWMRWEKTILALAYVVPLCGREVAALTLVPVDLVATLALFGVTIRRLWVLDAPRLAFRFVRSSPSRR